MNNTCQNMSYIHTIHQKPDKTNQDDSGWLPCVSPCKHAPLSSRGWGQIICHQHLHNQSFAFSSWCQSWLNATLCSSVEPLSYRGLIGQWQDVGRSSFDLMQRGGCLDPAGSAVLFFAHSSSHAPSLSLSLTLRVSAQLCCFWLTFMLPLQVGDGKTRKRKFWVCLNTHASGLGTT